jgi:hypothetical protein
MQSNDYVNVTRRERGSGEDRQRDDRHSEKGNVGRMSYGTYE